jgi:hypothetical protein
MVNGDFAGSLKGLIAEYDKRIGDAEKEVERLRGLRNAASLLLENETGKSVPKPSSEKPFAGMSVCDAVSYILRRNDNRPIHVADIAKMLLEGGWQTKAENPKLTVTGALVRELGIRFERTAANTFKLKDRGGNEAKG